MARDIDKYTFCIEWSHEDESFIARCLEFPSLSAAGDTKEEALNEIQNVVRESVEWLKEENEPVPEPFGLRKYKGNLTLRVSPQTHRELAIRASEQAVSINQYITTLIESNASYLSLKEELNEIKQQLATIIEQQREYPTVFPRSYQDVFGGYFGSCVSTATGMGNDERYKTIMEPPKKGGLISDQVPDLY